MGRASTRKRLRHLPEVQVAEACEMTRRWLATLQRDRQPITADPVYWEAFQHGAIAITQVLMTSILTRQRGDRAV